MPSKCAVPTPSASSSAQAWPQSSKQLLAMAGLAASNQGWLEEAEPLQAILDDLVPNTDLLNWLRAVHDFRAGRLDEARQKLEGCRLDEARALTTLFTPFFPAC